MRLFTILATLAALALSACSQPETNVLCCGPDEPPGAVQEQTASLWGPDTRTILNGDAARQLAHQCSRISPGPIEDVWTPTNADIEFMEDRLLVLLSQKLEEAGESPSPGDYYRQYAGYVIGGKRVIYVNGFNSSSLPASSSVTGPPFDWRAQPMQICDGGPITFGVEYDTVTKVFDKFAFNSAI